MREPTTALQSEGVSVIIPARNASATLRQTLDCLIAQTVPDWRAYIVNDCSTDDTADIVHAYMERDPRFHLFEGPGAGPSSARNIALAHATGTWLHFLDADDWVTPAFYEKLFARLSGADDAAALFSGFARVMPDGAMSWMFYGARIEKNPMEAFARGCDVHLAGVLLRRDISARLGHFDPDIVICQDWDLFQRVARLGGAWLGVEENLAFYRITPGSHSRKIAVMDADMRAVIARGFGRDERLAGLELAHPEGATDKGGEAEQACAILALWGATQYHGLPPDGVLDPGRFAGLPVFGPDWPYHVNIMIEGLMMRECVVAERLAARWPAIGADVTRLIATLGNAWGNRDAAHALLLALEDRILAFDDLAQPRYLSGTWGLRVDLRDPAPVTLPAGVERVFAYITEAGQVRAVKRFDLAGHISKRRWARAILAQGRTGGLRARDLLRLRLAALLWPDAAHA